MGDARLTLEALTTKIKDIDPSRSGKPNPAVTETIANAVGKWRKTISRISTENKRPIRPERLMADIDRLVTPDTIVVADATIRRSGSPII